MFLHLFNLTNSQLKVANKCQTKNFKINIIKLIFFNLLINYICTSASLSTSLLIDENSNLLLSKNLPIKLCSQVQTFL